MSATTPALARLGSGPLALAQPSPGRDWLAWAEPRAEAFAKGSPPPGGQRTASAYEAWEREGRRPYDVWQGVALVPVQGLLVNRLGWIGSSWITGYAETAWLLSAALADPEVRAVAMWIDSPGGMVDGLFDLTAQIRASRGDKPVAAIVDGCACSAAYAIAASCDTVAAGAFATVGSIGVLGVHWDFSAMLEEVGLRPTLIFSGARKVDGNPFQPLPDEVAARWQAEVDELRAVFCADVAAGRGGAITAEAAMATEAATYSVPSQIAEAERIGLIDAVIGATPALEALAAAVAAPAAPAGAA